MQADRLDFRPKHRLTVLVVQVFPLLQPMVLPRLPEYRGCTSWVDLPQMAGLGTAVHDDAALAEIADRVKSAVA